MFSIRASRGIATFVLSGLGVVMPRQGQASPAQQDGSPPASAAPTAKDPALAETLFADGKKRMSAGDYATACPKLAESYRLDPGTGTLAALALCHEHVGKTASAWAEFIQVVTEAQRAGRGDREKYARQHVASLEPTLSRLTITVAPETARLEGLQVQRDQVIVGPAAWGVASPIDPGDHVLEVTAVGKKPWSTRVVLGARSDAQSVAVPRLEDEAVAPSSAIADASEPSVPPATHQASTESSPRASPNGTSRTVGFVLGAVGLASIGVGSYFGIRAISESNTAKQTCSPSFCTDAAAVHANQTAKDSALVADVTFGGGLTAVVAAVVLVLTAPREAPATKDARASAGPEDARTSTRPQARREKTEAWRVVPTVEARGAQVMLVGLW